jgi:hypothetical protein
MARIELLTCGANFRPAKGRICQIYTSIMAQLHKSALMTGLASDSGDDDDGGGGDDDDGHLLHDSSIVEFVDIE